MLWVPPLPHPVTVYNRDTTGYIYLYYEWHPAATGWGQYPSNAHSRESLRINLPQGPEPALRPKVMKLKGVGASAQHDGAVGGDRGRALIGISKSVTKQSMTLSSSRMTVPTSLLFRAPWKLNCPFQGMLRGCTRKLANNSSCG